MLLEGLHIPLTTPFHPDGRLNAPKLAANVARYSRTPAAGLIALGPTGEPTLLSDDETREVLRTVAEAAAPEKVLIAGVSRDSVRATLELAAFAAEQHYDAVLVGAPTFLGDLGELPPDGSNTGIPRLAELHETEQLTFFQAIADRSSLPVVLLSNSVRSVSLSNAVKLAAHPNIVGILEAGAAVKNPQGRLRQLLEGTASVRREATVTQTFAAVTGRMQRASSQSNLSLISPASLATAVAEPPAKPALRTRTKSIGFQVLCADTPSMLEALNSGAVGVAPAFAAAAPQACYEVYAAWKDGDQSLASEKQHRLLEPARLCESHGSATLKFAADLNGYFGGLPRLPHLPPTGEQKAAIERQMKEVRN